MGRAYLNEKIPGKVTLIIEACKSASFLKPLANKIKRINLISSADADQAANTISNKRTQRILLLLLE